MLYLSSVYFITIKNEIEVTKNSNLKKKKSAEQTLFSLGLTLFIECTSEIALTSL